MVKLRKMFRKLLLLITASAVLCFSGCKQKQDIPVVQKPAFENLIVVPVPEKPIEGMEISYECPTSPQDPNDALYPTRWRGVFVKNRNVKLSPYAIGQTAVTYGLWYNVRKWGEKNGYEFLNAGTGNGSDTGFGEEPTDSNKDNPVTNISWRDCVIWCNAYTEMKNGNDLECVYRIDGQPVKKCEVTDDGSIDPVQRILDFDRKIVFDMSKKGCRLPTEAEWEYAARYQGASSENADKYGDVYLTRVNSASGAKKYWKDKEETLRVAWCQIGNEGEVIHPVRGKAPNALNIYDMSGNVEELVWDWWAYERTKNDSEYMKDGVVVDPKGPNTPAYEEHCIRVSKGGSFGSRRRYSAVGYLDFYHFPHYICRNIGFRIAVSL